MLKSFCAAILLAVLPSCGVFGVSPDPIQPAQSWVRASRANYDVIAPVLETYLEEDVALSPLSLEVLLGTLSDWDYMIRQGEAIYPPRISPMPSEPPPAAPKLEAGHDAVAPLEEVGE